MKAKNSKIDPHSAQKELDAALFPHYILGRQLALETMLKEVLRQLPEGTMHKWDQALSETEELARFHLHDIPESDAQKLACQSGFVHALQMRMQLWE